MHSETRPTGPVIQHPVTGVAVPSHRRTGREPPDSTTPTAGVHSRPSAPAGAADSSHYPRRPAAQNIPFRCDPAGQSGHGSAAANGGSRLRSDRCASPTSINRCRQRALCLAASGRQTELLQPSPLPGSSCYVGGDFISGVPVEAAAGAVVPHGGSRIAVRGRLLHVAQRDPGVQSCGDERMSQRMGRDGLADPGAAGGLADDPPCAVPIQPPSVRGASGMMTTLPPLRVIVRVR